LDVSSARQLVLAADMAHANRPHGADPMDVRDHVNWLIPWVTVDKPDTGPPVQPLSRWFPELAEWSIDAQDLDRFTVRPWWNQEQARWQMAMVPDSERKIEQAEPARIARRTKLTLSNGFAYIAAGRDQTDSQYHAIRLLVDGEHAPSTTNGDVQTNVGPGDYHDRYVPLSRFLGREIDLALELTPHGKEALRPAGIIWDEVALRPLILNLPDKGQPLTPDIPLTDRQPLDFRSGDGKPAEIQVGKNTDGSPVDIRGYAFETGFGVRAGSSVTYKLEPGFRRFVAVLGLSGGWQEVGAYEVYVDGEPLWTSVEPAKFGRNTPGLQVDIPIPAGHEQIELRVGGRESFAAWAAAGFLDE
jgi:hypothetical protein